MDAGRFSEWVERYRSAWESNDPGAIAALFTDDAEYYDAPGHEPWRGAQIVEEWLARKDEPGDTTFEYRVIATEGDLGIVRGVTYYRSTGDTYDNLWEIELGSDDRAVRFTEWWIKRP